MSFQTPWKQPYPDLAEQERNGLTKRLTINLPTADYHAILSVACNPAIFSLICQTALKTTANYVRANNLTYSDSSRLIDGICKRSLDEPSQEAPAHDDERRTPGILDGVTDVAEKSAGAGKKVTRRGAGKGGKG